MLLSDIKSGMVLEVLNEGHIDRHIVCKIGGKRIAFNNERTLGDIDYFFDNELHSLEYGVDLLKVMVITDIEWDVFTAINEDVDALKVIWSR